MSGLVMLCISSSPMCSAKISARHEATQGCYGRAGRLSSPLYGWLVEGESQVKCPYGCVGQQCQPTGGVIFMPGTHHIWVSHLSPFSLVLEEA